MTSKDEQHRPDSWRESEEEANQFNAEQARLQVAQRHVMRAFDDLPRWRGDEMAADQVLGTAGQLPATLLARFYRRYAPILAQEDEQGWTVERVLAVVPVKELGEFFAAETIRVFTANKVI